MGFQGLDGKQVGSVIMVSEDTKRDGEAWYAVNNPDVPFYYFSPAHLYLESLLLTKGDYINLKYRILHLGANVTYNNLNEEYEKYLNSLNN